MCFFAIQYVKDHDTAREIVQEAFVNLWEKRQSIDTDKSPKSYLSTTVRNRCFNYLRDHKKFDRQLIEFEGLDSYTDHFDQDHLVTDELKKKIEAATAALPEKCREVFLLNRMEHMKYQEIAEHLGISIKTVEAQMSKALKQMREKLAEYLTLLLIVLEIFTKQ
jgi:RNA polymerase sigma-70 factor (ECF subfamily)